MRPSGTNWLRHLHELLWWPGGLVAWCPWGRNSPATMAITSQSWLHVERPPDSTVDFLCLTSTHPLSRQPTVGRCLLTVGTASFPQTGLYRGLSIGMSALFSAAFISNGRCLRCCQASTQDDT